MSKNKKKNSSRSRSPSKNKSTIEKQQNKTHVEIVEIVYVEIVKRISRSLDTYGDLRQSLSSGAKNLATDIALRSQDPPPYSTERLETKRQEMAGDGPPGTVVPSITLDLSQLLAAQCPLPGQPGAPCFDGKEVTRFVRAWERFVEKYRITMEKMVRDLIDYCDDSVLGSVETLVAEGKREE